MGGNGGTPTEYPLDSCLVGSGAHYKTFPFVCHVYGGICPSISSAFMKEFFPAAWGSAQQLELSSGFAWV